MSENWPTEPPSWLGDVAAGVDAWTQRADEVAAEKRSNRAKPRPATGGRGSGRSETPPTGRRRRRTAIEADAREGNDRATGRAERAQRGEAGRMSRRNPPPEDAAARVPEADPEAVARKILLDQLTGAARSRAELRKKLDAKEVPEDLAERLLDRFTEVGLIDDAAFAESWVLGRQQAKGLAPRALAQELRRKGIDDETAREALDLLDEDSQTEAARALVRKKIRSLRRVDRTTATRRLVGMLARKGYGGGTAWQVVREELDGADFTDDGVEFPDPDL